ncbi:hypothetical protein [Acidisoma sp. C75]
MVFLLALVSLRITDQGTRGFIQDSYRAIGLFTANGSWAFDSTATPPPPLLFKLLAVIAPLVSVLGLTELITGRAASDCLRLRAIVLVGLGRKTPTAIFGLTPQSLAFARSLRRARGRELPVIFDPAPSLALLDLCDHERIAVFTLLPAQDGYLWPHRWYPTPHGVKASLLLRARHHVSFLAQADDQVGFAQALDQWLREREVKRQDFWMMMTQRGLRQRLDGSLRFQHQALRLRFFDLHSLAARQMLHKHRLDLWADALGQAQIHLAIYGFGNLGRAIAKEAARYYVTRASIAGPQPKLRLTIIDQAPDAAKAAFLADEPEIEKIIAIELRTARLHPGGLDSETVRQVVPDRVTAHIITLNEPEWMVAQALSLRRWLLEPPAGADQAWMETHRNAPIFVPIDHWGGLGSLVRSPHDGPAGEMRRLEVPDAIFGFGKTEELLHHDWIIAQDRDAGGRAIQEAYEAMMRPHRQNRPAAVPWSDLEPAFRSSNMLSYDHIAVKARAAGYRISPLPAGADLPDVPFSEAEKQLLAQVEHQRYQAERISEGWRQGDIRCDALRIHPDLRDWSALGRAEQQIDERLIEVLPAALHAVGKRFVKAHLIGIIGHRLPDARDAEEDAATAPRMDEARVRARLKEKLSGLQSAYPGAVLLTALATGADSWAAEVAEELHLPWIAILPLPYEIYREDFSAAAEGRAARPSTAPSWDETFRRLVAKAEFYVEMPLGAVRCSAMSRHGNTTPADAARGLRAAQYERAGRYIVERSDTLLAVWDGEAGRGAGGTADLVALRERLCAAAPADRPNSAFFPPPRMALPDVIGAK